MSECDTQGGWGRGMRLEEFVCVRDMHGEGASFPT